LYPNADPNKLISFTKLWKKGEQQSLKNGVSIFHLSLFSTLPFFLSRLFCSLLGGESQLKALGSYVSSAAGPGKARPPNGFGAFWTENSPLSYLLTYLLLTITYLKTFKIIKNINKRKNNRDINKSVCHCWITNALPTVYCLLYMPDRPMSNRDWQDAQLSQRDRAAACVIVFAKSRTLERGDNDLRIL